MTFLLAAIFHEHFNFFFKCSKIYTSNFSLFSFSLREMQHNKKINLNLIKYSLQLGKGKK